MKVAEVASGKSFAQSIEHFCLRTDLSRAFVYLEIKRGKLRAVKAGRRTLIRNTDAQAYLRSLPLAGGVQDDDAA